MTSRYAETLDQPALSAVFDLDEARRRSPSFARHAREVGRLFTRRTGGPDSAEKPPK